MRQRYVRGATTMLLLGHLTACGGRVTDPDPGAETRLHLRDLPSPGALVGEQAVAFPGALGYVPPAPFRKRLDARGSSLFVKSLVFATDDDAAPKDVFGGSFMSKPLEAQRVRAGVWQLRVAGDAAQIGDRVDLHGVLYTARESGGQYMRRQTIADSRTLTSYSFCYGTTSSRIVTLLGGAADVERDEVLVLELWAVLGQRSFSHGASAILHINYDGAIDGATEPAGACGTGSLNNDSRLDPPHPLRFR